MEEWQPVSGEELDSLIHSSLLECEEEAHRLYNIVRIQPEKWALDPRGNEGGGFWVVAVAGAWAVWYNDIEEGFNVSSFSVWGEIESYQCDKLGLHHILRRMLGSIQSGSAFPGSQSGPPQAVS